MAVIVVEQSDYLGKRVGEHIAPDAKPLLWAIGLPKSVALGPHVSCPGIRSVWGTDEPVDKDYVFHPIGEGINLSRPEFDRSLACLASRLGAVVSTKTRALNISRGSGVWRLTVAKAEKRFDIRSEVIIDATGRAAFIAKRLGAKLIVFDELVGVVGRTTPSQTSSAMVFIESVHDGWWYSAGLSDGSIIATFQTDPDLANLSATARRATWHQRMADTNITAARSKAFVDITSLLVRTARTQRLNASAGDGWLAVGDASMSFDPLSSEGISKGLRWGKRAASVAAAYCKGDLIQLKGYERDIGQAFSEYLLLRNRYYGAEKRWPTSSFWARRHRLPSQILTSA